MKKNIYSFAVILAAVLWGSMGFFRRNMDVIGISALGAVAVRCSVSCLFFTFVILIKNPKCFIVQKQDIWIFFCTGIVSLLVFSACYFTALQLMSLSAAAVLLYTAPCFVLLLSALFFLEKLTKRKIIAVIISFLGCAFVSGLGTGSLSFSTKGLILGLMSGVCYALYSIFSRFALDRGYDSLTINVYSTMLAGIGALIIDGFKAVPVFLSSSSNMIFCVISAFVTCFLPYLTYTFGLKGMENGKASVLASVEPVVATVLGVVVFKESITALGILGIVLVLSGIGIMSLKGGKE